MITDDLPWPELGNVSRGATRGNQGQKGVLGPPDSEGRCLLQLRVQPGVLAVRLNRQASDWYRILDGEVNRALKLTKTFWRKARRRQDYDSRADQDHMELHEWLQQLKDKTMSHLELLMQKGDIPGPPYVMPDDVELTFLRRFIERQAAGISHNPRLRKTMGSDSQSHLRPTSVDSASSEHTIGSGTFAAALEKTHGLPVRSGHSSPYSSRDTDSLLQESSVPYAGHALQAARDRFMLAQKETQEALLRYNSCLEAEQRARQDVAVAEENRDELMKNLRIRNQCNEGLPTQSPPLVESVPRYHSEDLATQIQVLRTPQDSLRSPSRHTGRPIEWTTTERPDLYSAGLPRLDVPTSKDMESHESRKHLRGWDRNGIEGSWNFDVSGITTHHTADGHTDIEELGSLPPRKRFHQMMGGFDVFHSLALPSQNLPLPS